MMRKASMFGVTAMAMLLIGWLSRAPYAPTGTDDAVLRLSWRARGDREQKCRDRTPEELAAIPAHMRTPQVCEGHSIAYRLSMQIDDRPPVIRRILPSGAKGDRPLFVFEELPLDTGAHRVRIWFGHDKPEQDHHDDVDDVDDDDHETHLFPPMAMDTVLRFSPAHIELITIDYNARRLVHRTGR